MRSNTHTHTQTCTHTDLNYFTTLEIVEGSVPNGVIGISLTWSFRPHYGPGVDSVSNINEYQEYFLGDKGGRCVGLTSLPTSCDYYLEILRTSNFWRPNGVYGPVLVFWRPNGLYGPVLVFLYLYLLTILEITHARISFVRDKSLYTLLLCIVINFRSKDYNLFWVCFSQLDVIIHT
jgi:hypothetical protein